MRVEHKTLIFKVITNTENEFCLWLADREVPPGWSDVRKVRGTSRECLAFIREESYRVGQAAASSQSLVNEEPPVRAAYA